MTDYYVGLMSGTSMDGIDAVLVSFSDRAVRIHATHTQVYPDELKRALLAAIREPLHVELDTSGALHRQVGECFRDAAVAVVSNSGIAASDVRAVGSHGQTLRHQPNIDQPFSLQIGDADIIAAGTGITTIANFRQADILAGGQGAPLVPPFHRWLFARDDEDRVVANIGGIANITILSANEHAVIGFDTGPGNGLMDAWTRLHQGKPFDSNGEWAASGRVSTALLSEFLADPYFAQTAPKSTGFEYFNLEWLRRFEIDRAETNDVQATLCELSARTIAGAIDKYAPTAATVFVCGGGAQNDELMRRLRCNLAETSLTDTSVAGLHPDWVESVAFAWLAMRTLNGKAGNLPSVTGARTAVVLGEIHSP